MKNQVLILMAFITCCGPILFSQTLPSTVPSKPEGGYKAVYQVEDARRTFTVHGQNYITSLTRQAAQPGHTWDPSLPIPISLERAEELARYELKKVADDEILWRFSDFSIARLTGTNSYLWYFAITLKPVMQPGKETSDSFTLLMNANGQPGRIGRLTRVVPIEKK